MSKRVLIVDDEPEIVKMLSMRLKSNGYEVTSGCSGKEAIEKAQQEMPDLILLDIMMPPPNGYEVCKILKNDSKCRNIPIILVSAKASQKEQEEGLAAGADEYITKPYDANQLMETIDRIISSQ